MRKHKKKKRKKKKITEGEKRKWLIKVKARGGE